MVEPPNMFFTLTESSFNEELSNDQTIAVQVKSTLDRFNKLLLAPAVGSTYIDSEVFNFHNMTVGKIMKEALSVGLSRSPDTHINLGFSEAYDSAGLPWPDPVDAKFNPGQSLFEVVEWLQAVGFGYASFGFNKKWIPSQDPESLSGAMELDRNSNTYYFNLYRDPLQGFGYRTYYLAEKYEATLTRQEDFKEVVNQLFVTGDNNICAWVKRDDSIAAYGVLEGRWSVSNAALHQTIIAAGERYLDLYAYPRTSQTLDIQFPPDGAILFYFPSLAFSKSIDINQTDLPPKTHSIEMLSLRVGAANHVGTLTVTLDNYFERRKTLLDQRLARLGLVR